MLREKLWEHNLKAVEYLRETFKEKDSAVIVQPTGSGKSGAMFAYIDMIFHEASRILIVQPTLTIENSHKASSLWLKHFDSKVKYITYSKLALLRDASRKILEDEGLLDLTLVVFDEVHHIAAPIWSQGYQRLKEMNPRCKFLGLTATPVRYLDGGLNVVDEYFNGTMIETLTLIEAIEKGIFAKPKYITAYFEKNKILEDMRLRIESLTTTETYKSNLRELYSKLKVDWSRQKGLDEIIAKYINKYLPSESNLKFIVFMSSIEELKHYKNTVKSWFKNQKVRKRINTYEIYSGAKISDAKVFESFSQDREDTVDILLSIDKLNEGVHLKQLSGVIMLRTTTSPIVYYQQLGRVFHTGMTKSPIVFDFVNNHSSLAVVRDTLIDPNDKGVPLPDNQRGTDYRTITLHDEMVDLSVLLSRLSISTEDLDTTGFIWSTEEDWENTLLDVNKFITEYGRLPQSEENFPLFSWYRTQILKSIKGLLTKEQEQKLKDLGVDNDL